LDASQLARRLGMSREGVYAHASEQGDPRTYMMRFPAYQRAPGV
jgi:DNA-binding phage protein